MQFISHRSLGWAVLVSELGHVFCCVLPTLFTILSFGANVGLIGEAPGFLTVLHEQIHHYEIPIILFSGGMVAVGWVIYIVGLHFVAGHRDCGGFACEKGAVRNRIILIVASFLFAVNVFIFAFVHKNIFNISAFDTSSTEVHLHHEEENQETH